MGVFPSMTTTLVIVGIWLVVSIGASLVLAAMFSQADDAELPADLDAELAMLTATWRAVSSRRGS